MGSASSRTPDSGMTVTPAADAAYIIPTLEGFRNKLLDLATRNNLLNLSLKSQRTARLLRFVNCNLQGILDGLMSEHQYSLSALPETPKEKQTFDEGEIEAALKKARAEDLLEWIPIHVRPDTGLDDTQA